MDDSEPKKIKYTRRQVLGLAALGGLEAAKIYFDVKKIVGDMVGLGIAQPIISDGLLKIAETITKNEESIKNTEFKSFREIIRDAVSGYETETGNKAYFKRESDYRDRNYYAEMLVNSMNSHLGLNPEQISDDIRGISPGYARSVIAEADTRQGSYMELVHRGSGFSRRFMLRHPEFFDDNGGLRDFTKYFATADDETRKEVGDIKTFIEGERSRSGEPVSSAVILKYYMKHNNGNIGESMYDTAMILKFLARYDTVDINSGGQYQEWFAMNIKDEYMGPNYQKMSSGSEMLNYIGKPYHSWYLVNMLRYFPVEVVRMGGISRQLLTLKDQGLAKTVSDITTLNQLRETEEQLLSYAK